MIPIERLAAQFLADHRNADNIVMNAETGLPVKAEYRTLKATGEPRKYPVDFYFSGVCDEAQQG